MGVLELWDCEWCGEQTSDPNKQRLCPECYHKYSKATSDALIMFNSNHPFAACRKLMGEFLREDIGLMLGYMSNIAMLLHDRYGVTDPKTRSRAALAVLSLIFDFEEEDVSDCDEWECICGAKFLDRDGTGMCRTCKEAEEKNRPVELIKCEKCKNEFTKEEMKGARCSYCRDADNVQKTMKGPQAKLEEALGWAEEEVWKAHIRLMRSGLEEMQQSMLDMGFIVTRPSEGTDRPDNASVVSSALLRTFFVGLATSVTVMAKNLREVEKHMDELMEKRKGGNESQRG